MRSKQAESRIEGYTLVELMIVITVIATIATMSIPNLLDAKMLANEGSAVASLRTICTVNEQYRTRYGEYPADLERLRDVGYLDEVLGSGTKSGYEFVLLSTADAWSCTSVPLRDGHTGRRNFFINTSGVIRFQQDGVAGINSDPLH